MFVDLLLSFLAGALTVLAPCILPFIPIILGGSLQAGYTHPRRRLYVIIASLLVSVLAFTVLLKASTALLGIPPNFWSFVSGALVIGLGLALFFPELWARIGAKLPFSAQAKQSAYQNSQKDGTLSAILTGAALGPVFNSCSPAYAWVLSSVLPASPVRGFLYIVTYCLGMALVLLLIALAGQKWLARFRTLSNPRGWFQRTLACLFILVGLSVILGWDKKLQTYLVEKDWLHLIQVEQNLVPTPDA